MGSRIPIVLDHKDEAQLLERDTLIQKHLGLVYKFAYEFFKGSRCHRKATYTIDDAIADGMAALLHAAQRYDPSYRTEDGQPVKFCTYASVWIRSWIGGGYMKSRIIYDKGSQTRWSYVPPTFEPIYDRHGDHIPIPDPRDDEAERTSVDNLDALENLLRFLPATDRRIIEDRFLNGLTLKRIAENLGIGKERVRQRQNRALERLREIAKDHPLLEEFQNS